MNRPAMSAAFAVNLRGRLYFAFTVLAGLVCATVASAEDSVEQWGRFELAMKGPTNGNPFLDVSFSARFFQGPTSIESAGFYDGEGSYRVRFMPGAPGDWRYITRSSAAELNGKTGAFHVTAASAGNHGPVHVTNTFHFAYTDGVPFKPFGTTCYAWLHQGVELEAETLKTLAASPFNKIRFCVFPKRYDWNTNEPRLYPFAGTPPRTWDKSCFNPAFFQHFERRIAELGELGIEADIILFHPYDGGHWGFDRMLPVEDERYLRYVVSRFAAFRNVWWSLANEYDFMKEKREGDWDRFFKLSRLPTRMGTFARFIMAGSFTTTRCPGSRTRAFKTGLRLRTPRERCSIGTCIASRWFLMKSSMKETFRGAGAICPRRSWCFAFGKAR